LEQTKKLLESLSNLKSIDAAQKAELKKRLEGLTQSVAESIAKARISQL
jgi:excinuclease UvrABC nuclease subunit